MNNLLQVNAQWVKYASRVDGRDKLCRATAYGSDVVLWLFTNSGNETLKRWMKQVKNVKSGVGMARKCFRVAAPLKDIDAVHSLSVTGTQRTMKVILHTFNAIYYFFDSIELLCLFDILPYKPADVKLIRYRFWIIKTIMNISLAFMSHSKAAATVISLEEQVEKSEGGDTAELGAKLAAAKKALTKARMQVIVALTDIPIAFFNTTEWGKKNVQAHWSGASGAVGSLISARLIWMEVGESMKKVKAA